MEVSKQQTLNEERKLKICQYNKTLKYCQSMVHKNGWV